MVSAAAWPVERRGRVEVGGRRERAPRVSWRRRVVWASVGREGAMVGGLVCFVVLRVADEDWEVW